MTEVLVRMDGLPQSVPEEKACQLPIHLLIVVGQTFSNEEKQRVLCRINSSLLSIGEPLAAMKEDLNAAMTSQLFDSNLNFDQENRILYNNETSLQLEVLVNSTSKTLRKAFRDFIHSHSKNKHFIASTLDLNCNGDLNLQDALFGYDNLNTLLNEEDIKKALLNTENSVKLHLDTRLIELNKNWKSLEKQHKNIHLAYSQNANSSSNREYGDFLDGLGKLLNETTIDTLMETGKLTGTLRISKPLLYIFPSREGDSAYFTLNGYSVLINGGYDRVKPSFWTFVNMLSQIDSILITHSDSDALGGLGSFFAKKLVDPETKPQVLTVLGNLIASSDYKPSIANHAQLAASLIANDASAADKSASYVDLIVDSIERLKIQLMPLVKSNDQPIAKHNGLLNNFAKYEHINLYYKLGQGSLDLYILSPFSNSTDYKEFMQQQQQHLVKHQTHQKSQLNPDQLFKNIPLSHVTSAVVLLVWMPHVTKQTVFAGENNALRLLFPGNAPQHVILNALEKVKDFEVLTSPVYKIKPTLEPLPIVKKQTMTTTNSTVKSATGSTIKPLSTKNISSKPPTKTTSALVNGSTKPKAEPTKSKLETSNISVAAKTKPKSAPVSAKPAAKPAPSKKMESASSTGRASLSKTTTATVPSTGPTTAKQSTTRLSTSKPSSTQSAISKKTLPPTKSTSKLTGDRTADEKSKIITKRDPKPSTSKPAVSKTSGDDAAKRSKSIEEQKPMASTDSVVVSVDAAASSVDLIASVDLNSAPVVEPTQIIDQIEAKSETMRKDESATEWPNLSPVKRDHADYNGSSSGIDGHYMEDRNNSIDTNNESGIDADTEGKERKEMNFLISDAKDLIQTPEDDKNIIETLNKNSDIMTRSFIDDGTISSNPFAASTEKKQDEDSINDLNKTHELSDYSADHTDNSKDLDGLTKEAEAEVKVKVESSVSVNGLLGDLKHLTLDKPSVEPQEEIKPAGRSYEESEIEGCIHNSTTDYNTLPKLGLKDRQEVSEEVTQPALEKVEAEVKEEEVKKDTAKELVEELREEEKEEEVQEKHGEVEEVEVQEKHGENEEVEGDVKEEEVKKDTAKELVEELIEEEVQEKHGEVEEVERDNIEEEAKEMVEENEIKSSVVDTEDPSKWNLLELPKPIDPNNLPAPGDKKQSGKKLNSPQQEKTRLSVNKLPSKVTNPVYVEVSYIPAHGDSHYVDIDFFRKVRARHYVLSTEEPTEKLLNAIIEAKGTWEDIALPTTIIPTYESDVLTTWFTNNEELLTKLNINITPAASMSTLTMDDNPDLTCQLFKLEF